MAEQQQKPTLANGYLPQMKPALPSPQQQFNGVHSAHSSRDSSPSTRFAQIPSSQLPPQQQLNRSPINSLTQKVGQLHVNATATFQTSTPVLNPAVAPPITNFQENYSPITSKTVVPTSSNSHVFDNVPLNSNHRNETYFNGHKQIGETKDKIFTSHQAVNGANGQFTNAPSENGKPFVQETTPGNVFVPKSQPIQPTLKNNNFSNQGQQFHPVAAQNILGNQNVSKPITAPYNTNLYQASGGNAAHPNQQTNFISQNAVPQHGIESTNYLNTGQQVFRPQNPPTSRPPPPQMPSQNSNFANPNTNSNIFQQQQRPSNIQPNAPNYLPPKGIPSQNVPLNPPQAPYANTAAPYPPLQANQQPASQVYPPQQPPLSNNNQYQQFPQNSQQNKQSIHNNRYPTTPLKNPNYMGMQQQQPPPQPQPAYQQQFQQPQTTPYNNSNMQATGVSQLGFDKYWGRENFDLLQTPNILPPTKIEPPRISLGQEQLDAANCSSEVFRCTMTKIPESNALLQKSRLPLGVLIHPFKDLNHLPVIQCNVIVRCRACRTYINPFVYFLDSKRWKCNLCYRINELPEEFQYDPVSKTYGDPSRRPEIKSSTIEYIAPAEYMLRPPQPAVYLFLIDISRLAIESGYLHSVSNVIQDELANLPGDARTLIGFLAYDSALHFFSLGEGLSQPHEMTVLDIDDVFLPTPDNLLVNLKDRKELVVDLLTQLPTRYANTFDNNSALGAALQAAYKMMSATGGRVTVFQASLPNIGPGALQAREDPSQRAATEVQHLNPANDFYKRLALECSGQQIAVDLFVVNSQYVDIATISGITRFSGGCLHHFPLFKVTRQLQSDLFERTLRRYIVRKIGFEAVMRIRCTRGLSIHTFHGNFFVRSTDLLSLPNINPDSGFGMQVAVEENLSDVQQVCFQAALLYTSSKGERRIRVHTLCLPIASTLHDIIHSADQQCIVGLLSKLAVDRSMQSSLSDAREAFINVAIDILSSYKLSLNLGGGQQGLLAPNCLKILPLLICALLKHPAFRIGMSTRLDDRVKAMIDMKTRPLVHLIQYIYPDLYEIHDLASQQVIINSETEEAIPMPPRLQLTARVLDSKGAFLMDLGEQIVILVCPNVGQEFLNDVLGVESYNAISDQMYELPIVNNLANQRLHQFVNYLNDEKPFVATIQIIKDNSPNRVAFYEHLIEDRMENALSYHEFLQHLKTQVK